MSVNIFYAQCQTARTAKHLFLANESPVQDRDLHIRKNYKTIQDRM